MSEIEPSQIPIQPAIDRAIEIYITERKEKVPGFVQTNFSIAGAFRLNRKALGTDLLKAPANLLWAVPYAGLSAAAALSKWARYAKISELVRKLPAGFDTRVQKEVRWLIYTELLEIPFEQKGRKYSHDALLAQIINQKEIADLFTPELAEIHAKSRDPKFREVLEDNLLQYARTRNAAAELAGGLLNLSAGAAAFGKMTPGALTVASSVAGVIAQQVAVSNFILGPTLGSLYYGAFPASASMGLLVATTGSIMATLGILTSFAGIISDPVQAKLGLHQKRLLKLIDCLEKELKGLGDSRYKIREHYISRVFDLLDMLRTAARTVAI
jgi:hypothetical protein